MPIIAAARNIGQKPVTFSSVFHAASIVPPAGIAFPYLDRTPEHTESLFIAYAHNGPTDPNYQGDIANLVGRGIPANQIVEITRSSGSATCRRC